jgi:hypothetical protein
MLPPRWPLLLRVLRDPLQKPVLQGPVWPSRL